MGWLKDRERTAVTETITTRLSSDQDSWDALKEFTARLQVADMDRRLPNGKRVPGWTVVTSRRFAFMTSRGLVKSSDRWADGDLVVDLAAVPHVAVSPPQARVPWKSEYSVAEVHQVGIGLLRVFASEDTWADFQLKDEMEHRTLVTSLDEAIHLARLQE